MEPILREISALTPLEQSRHLKRVQERFGKSSFSLTILREQVRAVRKERTSQARLEDRREKIRGEAPDRCSVRLLSRPGRAGVDARQRKRAPPDYAQAAEAAYEWFTDHGAQFFFTRHGEPFLHFDNAIYWMDSADRGRKRQYSALLYRHTGLGADLARRAHFLRSVLPSLALILGERCGSTSRGSTPMSRATRSTSTSTTMQHEIAKITPDGVELLKNGEQR